MTKKHDAPPAAQEPVILPAEEHRKLVEQAAQYLDQYRRTLAEFDNAKKRLERERSEAVRFGAERVLRDLLPIVDSFDHALKNLQAADAQDPVIVGIKLIHRQLHDLLHREGVVVRIGRETQRAAMADCSMVTSPYKVNGRVIGGLGVLGPKRMAYPRMMVTVDYVAQRVGELLSQVMR